MNSISYLQVNSTRLAYRPGANPLEDSTILMLHGWTGDETSMWVFTKDLPSHINILAPCAPYHADPTGFSWVEKYASSGFPDWVAFLPSLNSVIRDIPAWLDVLQVPRQNNLRLVGFSQGAALALLLGLSNPSLVSKVAAISGFLPELPSGLIMDASNLPEFFLSHGTRDEIVPVSYSRQSVVYLSNLNASVEYCESETKHRMSLRCMPELTRFLSS